MTKKSLLLSAVPAAFCLLAWMPWASDSGAPAMRVLIVAGGPDLKHNQVAIESNARYVHRLLPKGSSERILFTDGKPDSKNVLWTDKDGSEHYRVPDLPREDGASEMDSVTSELGSVVRDALAQPKTPVLLYFTGHGGPDVQSEFNNNEYDLWDGGRLTVTDLAKSLQGFPKQTPITLVMVQCYSGAFGNILFDDGRPNSPLSDRQIAGFFAAVAQRPAAGCTPEINELNYKDFTSYFFAALTGTDRLGRSVTGADYNHDGKVGMNEAYCYTIIHDDSIDTPVCTSDVFLRRFVNLADKEIVATPFSSIRSWADPAQLAAIDALSSDIGLTGEDRLQQAYDQFRKLRLDTEELNDVHIIRFVRLCKTVVLTHAMENGSDRKLKSRFESLLKSEAGNPLAN